jgi:hypothetical protein
VSGWGVEEQVRVGALTLRRVPVARDAGGGVGPAPAVRAVVALLAALGDPRRATADARAAQALVDAARADPALWPREDEAALLDLLYRALVVALVPPGDPAVSPTGVTALPPDALAALAAGFAPPFRRPRPNPVLAVLGDGAFVEPGDWVACAAGGAVAGVLLALDRAAGGGPVLAGVDVAPRDLPPPPLDDDPARSARPHARRQVWREPRALRRATREEIAAAVPVGDGEAALRRRRAAFDPRDTGPGAGY